MDNQTQEPVAWMYEDELPSTYPYDVMFQYSAIRDGVRMFPVFHPAPSWQELSDDEIIDMYFQASISPQPHQSIINFIRAIEQALKEKNT